MPPALIGEIFIGQFLSCVNDYIENMMTFTTLAKIYSIEYFCSTKVPGLGEILSSKNFWLYGICAWCMLMPHACGKWVNLWTFKPLIYTHICAFTQASTYWAIPTENKGALPLLMVSSLWPLRRPNQAMHYCPVSDHTSSSHTLQSQEIRRVWVVLLACEMLTKK